tara:strand:- start:25 stop:612 length:588 start_codon:yes stop_codon:yes gene_type:complete
VGQLPAKRKLRFSKTNLNEPEEREWHWSYWVMIGGLFSGLFIILFVGIPTVLSLYELSRLLAFFSLTGLLIPFKFYRKYLDIDQLEIVFFNIIGVGPIVLSVLLLLNYFIVLSTTEEIYSVKKVELLENSLLNSGVYYRLEFDQDELIEYPNFRKFHYGEDGFLPSKTRYVKFTIDHGPLWDVVTERMAVNQQQI